MPEKSRVKLKMLLPDGGHFGTFWVSLNDKFLKKTEIYYKFTEILYKIYVVRFGLWCLMPISAIFH